MSKRKKTNHPAKNLALSEEERKMADAGRSIFAKRMGELLAAWREDFRDVLFSLGADVAKSEDMGLLGDGQEYLHAIKRRLSLGLEYTVSDSTGTTEFGGLSVSYEHGIDSILSIARMLLPRHVIQNWEGHEHAADVESLRHEIDGCIIALVARGKLQQAADLMRLAGCVMVFYRNKIDSKEDGLRKGSSKQHSPDFDKLRVLLALDCYLQRSEIPTKFRLRKETFAEKEPSNFSVLLKGMRIGKLLPDESKGRKPEGGHQGSSFPATIWSEDWEKMKMHLKSWESGRTGDDCIEADSHPQRSTSRSTMIDRDIRVIREKLGSVYHLLLIEFGMSELEDEADLRAFESCLSKIGMRLL